MLDTLLEHRLFGLVTFLAGLLLGHWLSLGRDRRNEFNAAAEPIRSRLLGAADKAYQLPRWPSDLEVDRFAHCLPFWRRARFLRAYGEYERACQQAEKRNERNEVVSIDRDGMAAAAQSCLPYTVWR